VVFGHERLVVAVDYVVAVGVGTVMALVVVVEVGGS